MKIIVLLNGKELRYKNQRPIFPRDVVRRKDKILTCLDGKNLADLLKRYPDASVTIYSDKTSETFERTFMALLRRFPKKQLCFVVPDQEQTNHQSLINWQKNLRATYTPAHFTLEVCEHLASFFSSAKPLLASATRAVINP